MSRTVRTHLASKLLSGQIAPRPGMHGHDRPEREPVEAGPMASDENVERVAALTASCGDFFKAFREVWQEVEA